MRWIPVVLLLLPLASCASERDDPVIGRLVEVRGADLEIEIDDRQERVRLAGVIPPEQGECMYEEYVRSVQSHAASWDDLEVETVGKAPDGVAVVRLGVDEVYGQGAVDLGALLVQDGVAVIDAPEEEVTPEMAAARDAAYAQRAGLLSDYRDCTFGAAYGALVEQLDDAATFTPDDVDGADLIIDDLVAAVRAADAFLDTADSAAHDLRLLAYPPKVLAEMLATVEARRASAKRALASTKALRKKLRAEEERQRAIDRAEAQRWLAEWNARHHSSSGSSSGSSGGGGNHGYTGPRCYAPGGKTYVPC